MNYEKLDPALTMALEDEDEVTVFIEVAEPLSQQEADALKQRGVKTATPGVSLVTAILNKENVDQISELSSVRLIRLSQGLSTRS